MKNIPVVYLNSIEKYINVEEREGYICDHSFDEENNLAYYYSTVNNYGQEILLTDQYLLEHTGINYPIIYQGLKNIIVQEYESFINHLDNHVNHALVRYRAEQDIELIINSQTNKPGEEILGAKILLTTNPQYHKSSFITQTSKYLKQNKKHQNKPVEQIANFLDLIKYKQDLINDQQQIYSKLIVKEEHIPRSYWENQSRTSEEQGRGKIDITPEYKQEQAKILILDQEASLDSWLEYLNDEYPVWYQTYVIDGLKNMGSYDKEKNRFSKRRKDYIGTFPELNREALAKVYDHLYKYHNLELNSKYLNKELLDLLKTGSFVRLYEYFLINTKSIIAWDKKEIKGKWVKYEQTQNLETARKLAQSLEGYNTGWCTAGVFTAQSQLKEGDFYVYYSKNKLGFEAAPRIAIRKEGEQVAEIRGIETQQNLESIMTNIMKNKLQKLSGGQEYIIKTQHMEQLTTIHKKHDNKQQLSIEELKFLYELEQQIQSFGYQKDPRIKQIQKERNSKKDLSIVTGIHPEKIVTEDIVINSPKTIKQLLPGGYVHGTLSIPFKFNLPKNIRAKTINAENSTLEELAEGISADELNISNSHIKKLPEKIRVKRLISLNSKLEELPENLQVEDLFTTLAPIKKLPANFKAQTIFLNDSKLEELPENLQVEMLYINSTPIKELPKTLHVSRSLSAEKTPIKELPENLQVKNLHLSKTQITHIPKSLKVKDYLSLNYTPLETLPDNFSTVQLEINHTTLKKLPKGLKVQFLVINNSPIIELPLDLQVEELWVDETQLELFKNNLPKGVKKIEQVEPIPPPAEW